MKSKHLAFPARPCLGRLLLTVPRPPLTTLLLHAPPAPWPALVLKGTWGRGESFSSLPAKVAAMSYTHSLVDDVPLLQGCL